MPQVEERVDKLEQALQSFITSVGIEFNKLYNSQMRTEAELRAFKDEMRVSREESERDRKALHEEMTAFKDEMRVSREESERHRKALHEEMTAFKDEMRAFKDESRQINRETNMQWGAIAKKMGTMTEDLVAPSIPRIVREEFGLELESFGIRQRRRLPDGRTKEYDAVGTAGDFVLVDSTKGSLDASDVKDFVNDLEVFREFFPEYLEKKVIGMLATLKVEESVLRYAEKQGFLVIAVGDQLMEVKNTPGFKPKEW
jgi:hypothetical protein